MSHYEKLPEAIVHMRAKEAMETARGLLAVLESCKQAVETAGSHLQKGEYFLRELMISLMHLVPLFRQVDQWNFTTSPLQIRT